VQTVISTPALSTSVAAIFVKSLKLDFHSIGTGIKKRKISGDTFDTNDTQRIGFEIAT
jgi:hypothetical protein